MMDWPVRGRVDEAAVAAVCRTMQIPRQVALSRLRTLEATRARWLIARLLRERGWTLESIGRLLGRSAWAVCYGEERLKLEMAAYPEMARALDGSRRLAEAMLARDGGRGEEAHGGRNL